VLRRWFSLHFFTKTKQKIVVVLEMRRKFFALLQNFLLQGRSPQQDTLRVINGKPFSRLYNQIQTSKSAEQLHYE